MKNKISMFLVLIMISCLWMPVANAIEVPITSTGDPNADGLTLINAIVAANPNDIIIVDDGTYNAPAGQPFFLKPGVVIKARNPGAVTLDGRGNSHVVCNIDSNIDFSSASLEGFNITGAIDGGPTNDHYEYIGGGIYFEGSNATFKNLQIYGNTSSFGGGLCVASASNTTFENIVISNNVAADGGGVYLNKANVTFKNVEISGNIASGDPRYSTKDGWFEGSGGGMVVWKSEPIFDNVKISGNFAEYMGGGIYSQDSDSTFNKLTLSSNEALIAGGGMTNYGGNSTFAETVVTDNTALFGGGIYNYTSTSVFNDLKLQGNNANDGAGMYNAVQAQTTVNHGLFTDNKAVYTASVEVQGPAISGSSVGGGDRRIRQFRKQLRLRDDSKQQCRRMRRSVCIY